MYSVYLPRGATGIADPVFARWTNKQGLTRGTARLLAAEVEQHFLEPLFQFLPCILAPSGQ